jgi:hypothetical protein
MRSNAEAKQYWPVQATYFLIEGVLRRTIHAADFKM